MNIGFIGVGTMGMPMCENLLKKCGQKIIVYDIDENACTKLSDIGATSCKSASLIAQRCDVVFTMLPRDSHVQSVYDEMLEHTRTGQIYIDMSTVSPAVSIAIAQRIEEKHGYLLDAPVVKSRPAAIDGTLGIYVGGPRDIFEAMLPLLSCMGSNILYLGENGSGLVMKICHNMLVAQIQNGVNEMLFLAEKTAGISVDRFAAAIEIGGAKNLYLESKHEALANMDFTPAFATEYMSKDVGLAKSLCSKYGINLKGVDLVEETYALAMELGMAKDDFSSTYKLLLNK